MLKEAVCQSSVSGEAENRSSVCRKRQGYGIWLSIAFGFDGLENRSFFACFVGTVLIIQDQCIIAAFRNTDPVIRTGYRSKVAYEQQALFMVSRIANEAVDAAVTVVGIDPGEAVPVIVGFIKCRIFLINM